MSGHTPWRDIKHKVSSARTDDEIVRKEHPNCPVECGRAWIYVDERRQTYLTVDNEPALYCRRCAAREFGSV